MNCAKDIADFYAKNFNLADFKLSDEFYYSSLPLCLIDAVFSIGVTYSSTSKVVKRYCNYYDITPFRSSDIFPSKNEQHTIAELIQNIETAGVESFATEIVKNRQRTSSRNGILKTEAVLQCAHVLSNNEIETFQDFSVKLDPTVEKQFKRIKGQRSGISLAYLKMLCGNSDLIKPDRHLLRFLNLFSKSEINLENAQTTMECAHSILAEKYPHISIRDMDYMAWKYMKNS